MAFCTLCGVTETRGDGSVSKHYNLLNSTNTNTICGSFYCGSSHVECFLQSDEQGLAMGIVSQGLHAPRLSFPDVSALDIYKKMLYSLSPVNRKVIFPVLIECQCKAEMNEVKISSRSSTSVSKQFSAAQSYSPDARKPFLSLRV